MLPTPVEIKEKLVKALDDENDVDDGTVVEMVSILEKYPITRATLEETKIGKMVNDLRRKIKNEKLAKRVKQLVRNWKKILDETPSVNGNVPGPTHPALGQLRASPAVSPALSRVASAGRLVSPGQRNPSPAQGKPVTPKQLGKKSDSPALSGYKPVAGGSRKVASPGTNGLSTSSAAQKVASPALAGGHSRVASPAPVSRSASPVVAGRVLSPAVSSRVELKTASGRVASPLVSGHSSSPSLLPPIGQGKARASPLLGQSSVQSPDLPASQCKEDPTSNRSRLRKVASSSEVSSAGERVSQLNYHSEHSVDRLGGGVDRGRQDSDEESSGRSSRADRAPPHNHSIKTTVSLNSNNKNCKDQRELSKTNMANRKRAREASDSPPEDNHKKTKLQSSSLSVNSHRHSKAMNGYTPKSSRKHAATLEASKAHSVTSLSLHSKQVSSPRMSRTASEENVSLPHSHSDSLLMHQESTESNHSNYSFDRPSRDKHKVKTTEQLIEELQKKNNGSKIGHSIMTKLRTNQIEQEQDVPGSVLPAGMKPRGKRGRPRKNEVPSVPPSTIKLSQAKSELMERFLNTSEPSSSVEEFSPFKDDDLEPNQVGEPTTESDCNNLHSKDTVDVAFSSRQDLSEPAPQEEKGRGTESSGLLSVSHIECTGSALTLEEIYAQLPPVDHDIDWDAVDFFELPEPTPVTEEAVDRLHAERVPGVNGLFDINGDWRSWHQVMTLPSYEGNQLHILPYVDLDD